MKTFLALLILTMSFIVAASADTLSVGGGTIQQAEVRLTTKPTESRPPATMPVAPGNRVPDRSADIDGNARQVTNPETDTEPTTTTTTVTVTTTTTTTGSAPTTTEAGTTSTIDEPSTTTGESPDSTPAPTTP